MLKSRVCCSLIGCVLTIATSAQTAPTGNAESNAPEVFQLVQISDTVHALRLVNSAGDYDEWRLPYPVYRFCTGDVDGNGSEDALVGVVKATRYHPEVGRRIFIFKNFHGKVRALWMGSKLGGILEDFRFTDGKVRAVERTTDGQYVVAEYRWDHFGMGFERFLARNVTREQAYQLFTQISATCEKQSSQSPQP